MSTLCLVWSPLFAFCLFFCCARVCEYGSFFCFISAGGKTLQSPPFFLLAPSPFAPLVSIPNQPNLLRHVHILGKAATYPHDTLGIATESTFLCFLHVDPVIRKMTSKLLKKCSESLFGVCCEHERTKEK